jgi:hypothetical protein
MTPLYFACAWIIRPDTDYDHLMHLAAESECELVGVAPIQISQQGYAVMTFAVRTPSEAHLVEFVQVAGAEMGLTHWYGVPESYYLTGKPLYLNILPPEMRETWLAGMNAYGQHNVEQRRKLEE